jgi:sensor c-di-GMP phosphodiesterase-like protein
MLRYSQPKIALADGSIFGAEALVRWDHLICWVIFGPADS